MIICTYTKDRSDLVLDCIASLGRQTIEPHEILLVLEPREELQPFYKRLLPSGVSVLVSGSEGLSNARNTGVKNATGDIVVFIDDDATADKNWLRNMLRHYEDDKVIGVGGRAIPVWEGGRPEWFPEELDWIVGCAYKGLPEAISTVRNPIGSNMSFGKRIFKQVGYFKTSFGRLGEKLMGSEEAEFSMRSLAKIPGSKIIYDPSSVIYHTVPKKRARIAYLVKRSFYEGVSKDMFRRLDYSPVGALSTEEQYLSYLLKHSLPARLKQFYRPESLPQIAVILLSAMTVLAGYGFGHFCGCRVRIQYAPKL